MGHYLFVWIITEMIGSTRALISNIKTSSWPYRNSHYKDKTVVKQPYLYHGNAHSWKHALCIDTGPRSYFWQALIWCILINPFNPSIDIQWNPSGKLQNLFHFHAPSLQITLILPLMRGHLFWNATILSSLHEGVPLYVPKAQHHSVCRNSISGILYIMYKNVAVKC